MTFVMANVAEGFEWGGRPAFARFLSPVGVSWSEVRCRLGIASEIGPRSEGAVPSPLDQTKEVARSIIGPGATVSLDLP